jgi:HAD superfamily hydrolase (TIGR01450 family)
MQPRLILLDADGTVWRGNTAIPGAARFIRRAKAAGLRCLLVSNNAGPDRARHAARCAELGLDFAAGDIYSVNHLAGPYVARHYQGASTLVLGSDELVASMRRHTPVTGAEEWLVARGMPPLAEGRGRAVAAADLDLTRAARFDLVLVGIDLNVNYLKLALACAVIQRGARLLGANQDPTFPIEDGLLLPGNGSVVRLIAAVTGAQPEYLGKPELHLIELIEEETGVPRTEMLMIGDRIETDIVMAQRAGMQSILVLTGVSTAEQLPEGFTGVTVLPGLDEAADALGLAAPGSAGA